MSIGQPAAPAAASSAVERRIQVLVQRNRARAQSLGWGDARYRTRIQQLLGLGPQQWDDPAFVRQVRDWQASTGLPADGVIGPHTWRYLAVAAGISKDLAVIHRLPRSGPGFRACGEQAHQFGRGEVIRALLAVGAEWHRRHPDRPRITIRDISLRCGGPFPADRVSGRPRHLCHRLGFDVDIHPVRDDRQETPTDCCQPSYSAARTQELVHYIWRNGVLPVHLIFFNDRRLSGVRPQKEHDDHLHVRFRPPPMLGRP